MLNYLQINVTPNPVIFAIGNLSIRYYGLFIAIGVFIGLLLATKEAARRKLDTEIVFDLVLYGTISGIIGGRLLHVLSNFNYYYNNPSKIIAVWNGGLALHGGLLLATLVLTLYLRARKVRILPYLDVIAPAMILAQAIGRWGNFFNQEAFGIPTSLPWGIFIEKIYRPVEYLNYAYLHPTFFYESIYNLSVFIVLLIIRRKKWILDGEVAFIYLILYSIGRFFIEILRTDSVYVFSLKLEQLLSIAIITVASLFIYHNRKVRKEGSIKKSNNL